MSDLKIAVLGAGIVGTTTAIELQKVYRNATINIIADKFFEDTTSYVAAGLFRPGTSFCGPSDEITQKWIKDSYEYWNDIQKSANAAEAGVIELSGYMFSSQFPEIVRNKFLEKVSPLYRSVTEEELKLCPGNWKYGSFFTTLLTQSDFYIPWAVNQFKLSGGRLINDTIKSFDQLSSYDCVVNCTGLGAKFLCNDSQLVPIRGQVTKVKAPWIKTFFYGDLDTYIIPGLDSTVILGGCRQYESWDMEINKYDVWRIREQCEKMIPSLKNADLSGHKVGLRPHRGIVRVEKEMRNSLLEGRKIKIVHNYGHGGYGVTTAPGTSLNACNLVHELLSGNSKL